MPRRNVPVKKEEGFLFCSKKKRGEEKERKIQEKSKKR
jgi:hypothetical protein